MGVELFGAGPIVLLAVACIASYVVVGGRGIYSSQRVDTAKTTGVDDEGVTTLRSISTKRRHWLPARPILQSADDEATA